MHNARRASKTSLSSGTEKIIACEGRSASHHSRHSRGRKRSRIRDQPGRASRLHQPREPRRLGRCDPSAKRGDRVVATTFIIVVVTCASRRWGGKAIGHESSKRAIHGACLETKRTIGASFGLLDDGIAMSFAVSESDEDLELDRTKREEVFGLFAHWVGLRARRT